jgi:[ribosomal protein S5]-alanine N-acetyltransferase
MIIFETERLRVRQFTADDAYEFFLMNGDEEVVRYIRPVKTRAECDVFLQEIIKYSEEHPLFGRWAVYEKNSGHFVGSFAAIPIKDTEKMQLGYALLREMRGKGYATELTKKGIQYFFENTDYTVVHAQTESGNSASAKVLLRCGFTESGRHMEGEKEIVEFSINK